MQESQRAGPFEGGVPAADQGMRVPDQLERPALLLRRLGRFARAVPAVELWRGKALYAALGLCAAVFLYRLSLLTGEGAPPGSDPGNWLALSHELFGERVKAAEVSYPPVAPALLKGLSLFFPPLVSVSLLGAFASVAMGVPFFLLVRQRTGALWALAFTLGFLFLGYSLDMLTWGGYPQLLGQGLLLCTLYFLGKGLVEGRRRSLWVAAVSAALTVGTSTIAAALLAVVLPLFVIYLAVQEKLDIRSTGRYLIEWGALTLCLSLLFLPEYYDYFRNASENRTWNLHGYTLGTSGAAFAYVLRAWPGSIPDTWLPVGVAATLLLYCLWAGRPGSLLAPLAASLMAASLALFFTTFEVRVLGLLEVGLLAALAFLLWDLFVRLKHATVSKGLIWAGRVGMVGVSLALISSLMVGGIRRMPDLLSFYRVLDDDVVEALDWLGRNVQPGSVVMPSTTPQGFNYTWWIEGYSRLPAYYSADPRWQPTFKDERRQIVVSREFFTGVSSLGVAALAEEHHIRYVFIDRRVVADYSKLVEAGFVPAMENSTVVILQSTPGQAR